MDDPITITVGGVTVAVHPCGWRDMVELPDALDALYRLPLVTEADEDALRDGLVAFADRIDAYAAGGTLPSRVPPAAMREFVRRWVAGVRDAAVPPPSAAGSPKRASRSPRAARQTSP